MNLLEIVALRSDNDDPQKMALNNVYDPMFRSDLRLHAMTLDLYYRAGSDYKNGESLQLGIAHRSLSYFSGVRDLFCPLESWYNLHPEMGPAVEIREYLDRHYIRWHTIVDIWQGKILRISKS